MLGDEMIDILLVNYNLPEAVTQLRARITSAVPHRWIIVDNGSDIAAPHPDTTHHVAKNDGWMSGLSMGLDAVTAPLVWVLTTSMVNVNCDGDPLALLAKPFDDPRVVMTTPAWVGDMQAPTHLKYAKGVRAYQPTSWATPSAFWRADYLKANMERGSKHGWGTDFELTYLIRRDGLTASQCNRVTVTIREGNGYQNGRRPQSFDEKQREAEATMDARYTEKYGADWRKVLNV